MGAATQPRRLAVLALIACSGDRGITRDRLIALMWPDAPEESARRSLAQALHALRRDLGQEELFLGVQELRLNPDVASCDAVQFEAALSGRELERAAGLYGGPFADGFRVPGAAELERWIEEERSRLAHRYVDALERLARRAHQQGDAVAAVGWWRRIASLDPLNARVAVELMRTLAAAGERHAALQHARIYEALVEQELALEPDRQVVELAEELRSQPSALPVFGLPREPDGADARSGGPSRGAAPAAPSVTAGVATPTATVPFGGAAPEGPAPSAPSLAAREVPRSGHRAWRVAAVGGAGFVAVAVAVAAITWRAEVARSTAASLLAVGSIVDFRAAGGAPADPVAEMLATSLVSVPGLQVLSRARALELREALTPGGDTAGAWTRVAKRAGATELVEGGLYSLGSGQLLLELRRVDLRRGTVRAAHRVEGRDVFELVERATGEIAASLGVSAGGLAPGSSSLIAYRFYEEGLVGFARGDYLGAERLFAAALREDTSFALAAFYHWMSQSQRGASFTPEELDRVRRLSARANDRDRLLIQGWLAVTQDSIGPADTLALRYPAEPDGHYLLGFFRLRHGEIAEALPHFDRVLALDSASLSGSTGRCLACDAMQQKLYALHALDSVPAALRLGRAWVRRDPRSARAWSILAGLLLAADRPDEAIGARRTATQIHPLDAYDAVFPAAVRIKTGDFEEADRLCRALIRAAPNAVTSEFAYWTLAISLRYQQRWSEALALHREELDAMSPAEREGSSGHLTKRNMALVLEESGRPLDGAAIWDSLARARGNEEREGSRARRKVMMYVLAAGARFEGGDTSGLAAAVDSATVWERRSPSRRDAKLIHHGQGLLALSRADTASAMRHFTEAIYSPTLGFTRSNRDLARVLLARGEARPAVPLLSAALRSGLDGANLYVSHTELHALLASAYRALGLADSAAAHRRYVDAAVRHAEPGTPHPCSTAGC